MKNDDQNPKAREQLEERITALLLGELSPEEENRLRKQLDSSPELTAFHQRMKSTIGLVQQAAAAQPVSKSAEPAPAKLSDPRRKALLERFQNPVPAVKQWFIKNIFVEQLFQWRWTVPAALAACLIFFLGMQALLFRNARRSEMVIANLKETDGAPARWSLESSARSDRKDYARSERYYEEFGREPAGRLWGVESREPESEGRLLQRTTPLPGRSGGRPQENLPVIRDSRKGGAVTWEKNKAVNGTYAYSAESSAGLQVQNFSVPTGGPVDVAGAKVKKSEDSSLTTYNVYLPPESADESTAGFVTRGTIMAGDAIVDHGLYTGVAPAPGAGNVTVEFDSPEATEGVTAGAFGNFDGVLAGKGTQAEDPFKEALESEKITLGTEFNRFRGRAKAPASSASGLVAQDALGEKDPSLKWKGQADDRSARFAFQGIRRQDELGVISQDPVGYFDLSVKKDVTRGFRGEPSSGQRGGDRAGLVNQERYDADFDGLDQLSVRNELAKAQVTDAPEKSRQLFDVDGAVRLGQLAVPATPQPIPEVPVSLNGRANQTTTALTRESAKDKTSDILSSTIQSVGGTAGATPLDVISGSSPNLKLHVETKKRALDLQEVQDGQEQFGLRDDYATLGDDGTRGFDKRGSGTGGGGGAGGKPDVGQVKLYALSEPGPVSGPEDLANSISKEERSRRSIEGKRESGWAYGGTVRGLAEGEEVELKVTEEARRMVSGREIKLLPTLEDAKSTQTDELRELNELVTTRMAEKQTAKESLQKSLSRVKKSRPASKPAAKPKAKPAPKKAAKPAPTAAPVDAAADPVMPAAPARPPAEPLPEIQTAINAFSTFSLNVSDVAFRLAAASLHNGVMPEPASIRSEEFVNAFNYRDPAPSRGEKLAFAWQQAHYPFAHNRDLVRFSIQTAAIGREPGRPLNLVLLLDNSGSMERADRVQIVRQALAVLSRQLTKNDRISVVAFARTPRLWVDGYQGGKPKELVDRVGNLNPEGGTNLELALELGYSTAQKHFMAKGNNRVILLTDGAANLGDVNPLSLKQTVEAFRHKGIALDCFGVGWEGYNDDLLEVLSRNGDGRYGFINDPLQAATEFADQLAGALRVAAANVKAQIEFNPDRVISYRQIGYEKHQLTKEQFRDNTVDAAEIGAAESGTALYSIQVNQKGIGPLGVVRVRYKSPSTGQYEELEWLLPYNPAVPALDKAYPAMRLAAVGAAFAEFLARSPYASQVTLPALQAYLNQVPELYSPDLRPQQLLTMIQQARNISGQ